MSAFLCFTLYPSRRILSVIFLYVDALKPFLFNWNTFSAKAGAEGMLAGTAITTLHVLNRIVR